MNRDTIYNLAEIFTEMFKTRAEMERHHCFLDNTDLVKVCDIAEKMRSGQFGVQIKLYEQ